MQTLPRTSTISIHFWNLERYVGGDLVGGWVDLDACLDFEDFQAKVAEVTGNAEELILGDYESDCGISFTEYVALDTVWEAHEAVSDILSNERDAFGDFLAHVGGIDNLDYAVKHFQDAYQGNFRSLEDFVWNMADDLWPDLANVPAGFRVEIDIVAWECDFWISDSGNVFSNSY